MVTASQKILGSSVECQVAAFNISNTDVFSYPPEVKWEIDQEDIDQHKSLADEINNNPQVAGVVIQHEYGIFGGADGENILTFVKHCQKPILATFHTVLPNPNPNMNAINKKLIAEVDHIVVLTRNSKNILEKNYKNSRGKVHVIPHGIHHMSFSSSKKHKKLLNLQSSKILTTFGLLSRSKGIEWTIKALPAVVKSYPNIKYLILGQTHPIVRRNEGESYRLELIELVKKLKLTKNVKFYDKYLKTSDLLSYLKATDIYLSTSTNPNQAVSGTLSYAVGAGRVVISTSFTQAQELITSKIGRLVPIQDAKAFSNAILEVLMEDKLRIMGKKAYRKTRNMLWSNVGHQYLKLLYPDAPLPPISMKHLQNMTDDFGMIQFAQFDIPIMSSGYTLDDNSRAALFCSEYLQRRKNKNAQKLLSIYLNFMEHCQRKRGYFVNYINAKTRKVTSQNRDEAPTDPHARTMWALSHIITNESLPKKTRKQAMDIWTKALPASKTFSFKHSKAFMIKGLATVLSSQDIPDSKLLHLLKVYADSLVDCFEKNSTKSWQWFDHQVSYSNGLMPECLYMAWQVTGDKKYLTIANKSLEFLIKKSFMGEVLMPVGQKGWYKKGGRKSEFDQQPEEPNSLIFALSKAFSVTANEKYKHLAEKAFTWFLGNNILGEPLYDHRTGGCHDGLTKDGVNFNFGAESLISYLLSRIEIEKLLAVNESNSDKRFIPRYRYSSI